MTAQRHIIGGLWVDMGQYQPRTDRWIRQPNASYWCGTCARFEGPVHGPTAVQVFIEAATARHNHNQNPTQHHNTRGARAA
ncbi:hypothetical protein ACFCZV_13385 [Streptomyces hydrogenans]|uniref:hypothetical protein n=1 Tax=Streptomyces hydrogenans TaxID=1873719 RepID=UPI0035E153A9